jgi:hypothetical protein
MVAAAVVNNVETVVIAETTTKEAAEVVESPKTPAEQVIIKPTEDSEQKLEVVEAAIKVVTEDVPKENHVDVIREDEAKSASADEAGEPKEAVENGMSSSTPASKSSSLIKLKYKYPEGKKISS